MILRKGGIQEEGGEFQVEHKEFFLFPTYEHQSKADLKAEAQADLDMIIRTKPDPREIPLRYYAQVVGVSRITEEADLEGLRPYHVWSDEAVKQRFRFGREKGLFVLTIRVFRLPFPHLIASEPEYAGCKSWVELKKPLTTDGARPVLSDSDFERQWQEISAMRRTLPKGI